MVNLNQILYTGLFRVGFFFLAILLLQTVSHRLEFAQTIGKYLCILFLINKVDKNCFDFVQFKIRLMTRRAKRAKIIQGQIFPCLQYKYIMNGFAAKMF